jgi:hypothetical protein
VGALLSITLWGCGGGAQSTGPKPTPTTEHAASPTPLERQGDAPSAFSLTAGTYISQEFQPTLSFTIDRVWDLLHDEPDTLVLGYAPDAEIAFLSPAKVYDGRTGRLQGRPDDFAAWLEGHPSLEAIEKGTLEVGDVEATAIDSRVIGSPPGHPCPREGGFGGERSRCVAIAPISGDAKQPYAVFAGDRLRFVVVEAEGSSILITLAAPPGLQFDEFVEVAEAMLKTVQFSQSS